MKKISFYILVFITSASLNAQETLSDLLKHHNSKKVDYISVQELAMPKTDAIILDARELEEYQVSHIKNAIWVGYNHFKIDTVLNKISDKSKNIVVYCSVGIRSEKIAYKLKKAGYKNVTNLYGGIFEWKNNDFNLVDTDNKNTEKVHIFSETWGKWLKKGKKIY